MTFGRHQEIHSKRNNSYPCDYCDSEFSFKGNLHRHLLKRIPSKKYSCEICNFNSCSNVGLSVHRREVHQTTKKRKNLKTKTEKTKNINYFPEPRKGKWIVILERFELQ